MNSCQYEKSPRVGLKWDFRIEDDVIEFEMSS